MQSGNGTGHHWLFSCKVTNKNRLFYLTALRYFVSKAFILQYGVCKVMVKK